MPKKEEASEESKLFYSETMQALTSSAKPLAKLTYSDVAVELIEQNPEINVVQAVIYGLAAKAMSGDVACATFLRDTVGEKPKDKSEVDNNISVDFSMTLVGDGGSVGALSDNNPIEASLDSGEESGSGEENGGGDNGS